MAGVLAGLGTAATIAGLASTAVSVGTGVAGAVKGASKSKKANSEGVGVYNPVQTELYEALRQKKKALETGTAYAPTADAIRESGAANKDAAIKMAGGGVGATIAALKNINRGTGRNINEMLQTQTNEGMQMNSLLSNVATSMANRQYQIGMADKLQKLAEGEQLKKDAGENVMTSLTQGLGSLDIGAILAALKKKQALGLGTPAPGTNVGETKKVSTYGNLAGGDPESVGIGPGGMETTIPTTNLLAPGINK
jgi:hypothetical protein